MAPYPQSYHKACQFLVAFGGIPSQSGRNKIAQALKDVRNTRGREDARFQRKHLLFISGRFPTKN